MDIGIIENREAHDAKERALRDAELKKRLGKREYKVAMQMSYSYRIWRMALAEERGEDLNEVFRSIDRANKKRNILHAYKIRHRHAVAVALRKLVPIYRKPRAARSARSQNRGAAVSMARTGTDSGGGEPSDPDLPSHNNLSRSFNLQIFALTDCQGRFDRLLAERPRFRRTFIDGDYSDTFQNLHAAADYLAVALLWVTGDDASFALFIFNECPLARRVDPVKAIGQAQRERAEKRRTT